MPVIRSNRLHAALVTLACIFTALTANAEDTPNALTGDLMVFHAGSLSVPFRQIAKAFQEQHPGVRVLREAAGSRACARKIADLDRPCDIFASADYTVIETLLIPKHADWCLKFASNEMVIAYRPDSRGAGEITRDNWPEVLLREEIAFGRAEPNADPCGYRTVLTAKLAEKHYARQGLAERLLAKDQRYIRPKETDLLALLETYAIDYLFIYRSVAEQHQLECVLLPDEVNLKDPKLADLYRSVTVEVSGKKPGEVIVKRGEPMVYGLTIPKNAPNPEAALAFVQFLLDPARGMAIMKDCGQPSVVPSPSASYAQLPQSLRPFATEE
ncbi:MAG: extracellular solute-binding protein [Nitrospiraceae bacterium]|nr:extracellular solute-binding protein [Nitrospiraceae bacterium]